MQTQGSLSHDVPALAQFVPSSTKLVAYSSPLLLGKVLLFDYRSSCVVRSVHLTQMVASMHLARDGSSMAFGGMAGSVFLVDVDTGRWDEMKAHMVGARVQAVQFAADSSRLVTASGSVMMSWHTYGRLLPTHSEDLRSKIL